MSYRALQDEIKGLSELEQLKLMRYIASLLIKKQQTNTAKLENILPETAISSSSPLAAIRAKYGLSETVFLIEQTDIETLSKPEDQIDCWQALNKGIHSIITEGEDADSLYANLRDVPDDYGLSYPPTRTSIKALILEALNTSKVTIELVTPKTRFQAEHGENAEDFWIFLLQHTQLFPGLIWAVVNRKTGTAYNYGHN